MHIKFNYGTNVRGFSWSFCGKIFKDIDNKLTKNINKANCENCKEKYDNYQDGFYVEAVKNDNRRNRSPLSTKSE